MVNQFHKAVSLKPFSPRSVQYGSDAEKYAKWLYKTARRKGYDAFVYLSDQTHAGDEHGSQVAVLDTRIIEVLDWQYIDRMDELDHLDRRMKGYP